MLMLSQAVVVWTTIGYILLHIGVKIYIFNLYALEFVCGACSSGVEHLPFKQRVGGSSPPTLTKTVRILHRKLFFSAHSPVINLIGLSFCPQTEHQWLLVRHV